MDNRREKALFENPKVLMTANYQYDDITKILECRVWYCTQSRLSTFEKQGLQYWQGGFQDRKNSIYVYYFTKNYP